MIDPRLEQKDKHEYQLSLYPACNGSTQTALLNLNTSTEYFQQLKPDDFNYVSTAGGVDLVIDSHFYDLTPLNSPRDEVVAELVLPVLHCLVHADEGVNYSVIAVTGLAGHAFESWRNCDTHKTWLKDFLPRDVKNVRIMTYGYDSGLVGSGKCDMRLIDYRRNFIQQLENSRSTAKVCKYLFPATEFVLLLMFIRIGPSFSWGTVWEAS
jgi:hypothetical protein